MAVAPSDQADMFEHEGLDSWENHTVEFSVVNTYMHTYGNHDRDHGRLAVEGICKGSMPYAVMAGQTDGEIHPCTGTWAFTHSKWMRAGFYKCKHCEGYWRYNEHDFNLWDKQVRTSRSKWNIEPEV